MPKEYEVSYLSLAENDLVEILDYISTQSKSAAIAFLDNLDRSVTRLKKFPEIGSRPKDDRLQKLGYRIIIVDDYLVFYVVKEKEVEIRRIIHGRRRYEFLI